VVNPGKQKGKKNFEPSQPLCKLNQKYLPLVFSPCDQPIQVERIELFLDLHNDLANKSKQKCVMTQKATHEPK